MSRTTWLRSKRTTWRVGRTLSSITGGSDLQAVKTALGGVHPRPRRLVLFGSRARGEARPDSDIDLLVVRPQPTLTPTERQLALRSLRAALRPLPLKVGVDLVVVSEQDVQDLSGSHWHVVARAYRLGLTNHNCSGMHPLHAGSGCQ